MGSPAALKQFDEAALKEWVERDERRLELEREARQLDQENKLTAQDLLRALKEAGKTKVARGLFEAEIENKRSQVSWKDVFLRIVGAEAASKIAANAPMKESVKIRRVG